MCALERRTLNCIATVYCYLTKEGATLAARIASAYQRDGFGYEVLGFDSHTRTRQARIPADKSGVSVGLWASGVDSQL